jgi:predicted RecA/RadA family phage recombinase
MNNFIQPGDDMTFTAPSGGVVSGNAYLIGALLVVAKNTVAEHLPFPGAAKGVVTLPKHTGTAWTEGELLYWDDGAGEITTVATSNTRAGVAAAAAASGDTTGTVRLSGVPSTADDGEEDAALAAPILEDSGTISASATVVLAQAALMIQSTRVVTSGTAGSVGCYLVADHSATPCLPAAASTQPGVATISADGLTLTFPNTVTRVVTQYIPRVP